MADARFLLGGLAPFAAAFIGVAIYSKVDVLLMSRWRSELDVGVYVAAYKFVDIFQALVIVAAAAVYPRLSRTAASRSWAGARSTEIILLAAVPAGLALHLVAGPATALLFGSDYAVSAGTVRILGLVLPLLAISIHGAYVLGAAGNMRPVAALYAVGIAVNILLNRSLIPAMGPQGAALARLASEAVMAIGFVGVLHVVARSAPGPRTLALAACAGALGWLAGLFPDPTGGWLRVAGAAGAWLALYVGGGALGRTEVRALTSALREGRSSGSRAGRTLDHAGQGAP
jgi:O-antigen/teichoic acid export membrane protein